MRNTTLSAKCRWRNSSESMRVCHARPNVPEFFPSARPIEVGALWTLDCACVHRGRCGALSLADPQHADPELRNKAAVTSVHRILLPVRKVSGTLCSRHRAAVDNLLKGLGHHMRRKLSLDTLSQLAVVVACVWCGYVLYNRPTAATAPTVPVRPSYEVGDTVDVKGVDFSTADSTVLLFIRSSCQFCTDSMPFYQTLRERMAAAGSARGSRMVVVTTDSRATATSYLGGHGVVVDDIRAGERFPDKIWATPTVVVVSRDGRVRGTWRGQLPGDAEADVIKAAGL